MNARPDYPPSIAPARWVVMRLPGMKHDPLQPPIQQPNNTASGRALNEIDENIPIAPAEGKSRTEVFMEHFEPSALAPRPPADATLEESQPIRFSLAELMFLMTAVAVGLAGVRILSPAPFAAAVGGLTFFYFWLTTANTIRNRWVHVAGWGLLAVYLAAAISAFIRTA